MRRSRVRYKFYLPDIFRFRTIVHCVTNLSWFCNQTSYLMFSILGQWIYHDFESIQPCISSFSFPWDMEFVMALSPYFTSDSIFFSYYDNKFILLLYISSNLILSQRCKGDNSNWLYKILHWNLPTNHIARFNLKSG